MTVFLSTCTFCQELATFGCMWLKKSGGNQLKTGKNNKIISLTIATKRIHSYLNNRALSMWAGLFS